MDEATAHAMQYLALTDAMGYEAWRITYQDSEKAARAAFAAAAKIAAENAELRRLAAAIETDMTEPAHRREWAKQLLNPTPDTVAA